MNEGARAFLRAKRIAIAASTLVPERRQGFVDAECGGDDSLREQVRWLLDALQSPTVDVFEDLGPAPPRSSLAGTQVPAREASEYLLLERIGQGGMGDVYLAERRVGGARQKVAVKLLKMAGQASEELLRRFARERRILAALEHPNIARLLDAGSMADGQPFLAMEYVQGVPIDVHCRERALPLDARLRLFVRVCAAVQYAHQHLIVHRDIKPANILVDAQGNPCLLDFGVARLLNVQGAAQEAATVTRSGWGMTPAYASPEQLRAEPLTTSSDIWSLGAVLYELLCGQAPFAASGNSPLDVANAIVNADVQPPSRREQSRPAVDRLRIPADVDAIVLKAMRKSPDERYATVASLAEDVQRFLDSRPVLARRGHSGYRALLYLRRHRTAVTVVVIVVTLLSLGLVDRYEQVRRIETERDKAQALAGFMQDMFEHADPTRARGRRITVAEMLDQGAARLGRDTTLPAATRADLMLSIGMAYNQLDIGDRARAVLHDARRLQERSGAGALERGRVLAALGRAHSLLVDLPGAAVVDREAIALLQQARADPREILRVRINLLYSEMAVESMPMPEIERQLEHIVAALRAGHPRDPELEVQALAAHALSLAALGRDEAAKDRAGQALDKARAHYSREDPTVVYYRFVQALVMLRSDPQRALALYRTAIDDYDRLFGRAGPGLAGLLAYFGDALAQSGRFQEAQQAVQRALEIGEEFEALAPEFSLQTQLSMVAIMLAQGRVGEADGLMHGVLGKARERLDRGGAWSVANALAAMDLQARLALAGGDAARALALYEQAQQVVARHAALVRADTRGAILGGLGQAQFDLGRSAAARATLQALQALNRAEPAAAHADRALLAGLLQAKLMRHDGRTAEAAAIAARAMPVALVRWGPQAPWTTALRELQSGRAMTGSGPVPAPAAPAGGM